MKSSKSSGSFTNAAEYIEVAQRARPRARSSLDTFVIPGRTRLPSSKSSQPESVDIQITQNLLNHDSVVSSKLSPRPSTHRRQPYTGETKSPDCKAGSEDYGMSSQLEASKIRPSVRKHPPPQFHGRGVVVVRPPQDLDQGLYLSQGQRQPSNPFEDHNRIQTYDGGYDSGQDSRVTSMTWSSISRRVFTDSSGSSHAIGNSHCLEEYNRLAEKRGLPQLPDTPDDHDDHTHTSSKPHQGWLARKLFRRSSSTYSLKAKTTYKPISRKKSFGIIPVPSESGPKSILKDKSLEETSRLGGLGILSLPHDYAIDKLTLPTCLSATATYLCQHGCNSPGIFRVSGQSSTVNALYDFYDHQFSNAGSPSRVQETVGSGLLPSHIEHTVTDVASLFKKFLIGMPGGLLGSLALFEALRAVVQDLRQQADQSEVQFNNMKARMIALAICSVPSSYRSHLIQAVIGLAAYFGHEAREAATQVAATAGQGEAKQQRSELMGCHALGVVLGPLLLGDLTDSIVIDQEPQDIQLRTSTDGSKKSRKSKRHAGPSKLETNSTLTSQVERANLTASVMQLLLTIWRDVVKQLREINGYSSSMNSKSDNQIKKMRSLGTSRLSLRTSEEDMLFLDVLRGRTLPDELRGEIKMKRKVRISSRSPMARGAIKVPEGSRDGGTWLPGASDENNGEDPNYIDSPKSPVKDATPLANSYPETLQEEQVLSREHRDEMDPVQRRPSDVAMEDMARGTILQPLQELPIPPENNILLPRVTPATTSRRTSNERSTADTPETALKTSPRDERHISTNIKEYAPALEKPLPAIGNAEKAEISAPCVPANSLDVADTGDHPFSQERAYTPSDEARTAFPTRLSSLLQERPLPMRPIETYESLAEYKAKADTHMSPSKLSSSRKVNEVSSEEDEHGVPDESKRNSVKLLAQQFAEASRVNRYADKDKNVTIPKVFAYVQTLPSSKPSHLEDSLTAVSNTTPEKDSLIPKPVWDVGRARRAESRSPSPPKRKPLPPRPSPKKRPSVFNFVSDQDNETPSSKTLTRSDVSETSRNISAVDQTRKPPVKDTGTSGPSASQTFEILRTRHLSAYSADTLNSLRDPLEEPPVAHHVPTGVTSANDSSVPNNYLEASEALIKVNRHGSINATLYAQIRHLQRQLEQKGEEVQSARRSLEAVRDARDDTADSGPGKGVASKGTLSEEIRETRKELNIWKRRAELAERRLEVVGGVAKPVAVTAKEEEKRVTELASDTGSGSLETNL